MSTSHEQPVQVELVFWGHACFGIHVDGQPLLLIDPFDPRGLAGVAGPPPIPLPYPYLIASHEHSDHAAFHTQPNAQLLHAPCPLPSGGSIDRRIVAHDEFGGRLRGGTSQILDLRLHGVRIVHCGDLGERLQGDLLTWLQVPTPEVLIVPAGGYFTLGADGASELAAAVEATVTTFCHTQDDGLPLPPLAPQDVIRKRVARWPSEAGDRLIVRRSSQHEKPTPTTVVWLRRPDGLSLDALHTREKNGEEP